MKDICSNRVPPNSAEAEAAVLGAVLLENRSLNECLPIIGPDDFYYRRNEIIYRALCELSDTGGPIDSIILSNFLKERGRLDKSGGQLYISELMDSTVSSANIAHYARIIKNKSVLRAIIAAADEMTARAHAENGEGHKAVLDEAQRALMEISADSRRNVVRDAKDLSRAAFQAIEDRHQSKSLISGLSTGFTALDNWTSGFQASELVIIAGRPGMGKTALGVNILENAVLSGVPGVIFSLEMSGEALMTRIFSSLTGIDSRRLGRGCVAGGDWPHLIEAANQISAAPLFIDDSPVLTAMQLRAKARRLKIEKGIGLIVIDYLQLMQGAAKSESREREIAEISRSLKALAKELQIPVVALSQLNRAVENRAAKQPSLADLRESGAIEQDADLILLLFRDEVYNPAEDNPEKGFAEIIIGKQRNGPTGKLKMKFDAARTKFTDWER
jgi:replicative DNA helicase